MIKRNRRKQEKFNINNIEANKMMDKFKVNDIFKQREYIIYTIKKAASGGDDHVRIDKWRLYNNEIYESIKYEIIANGFKIKQDDHYIYISW